MLPLQTLEISLYYIYVEELADPPNTISFEDWYENCHYQILNDQNSASVYVMGVSIEATVFREATIFKRWPL